MPSPHHPRRGRAAAGALLVGAIVAGSVASGTTAASAADTPVTVSTSPYVVAAVSAPSVEFDLDASLEKADAITARAAAAGAKLVSFGELWLPGYPKALNTNNNWGQTAEFQAYVDNSIVRGSAEWDRLVDIADDNDVYLSIGFSERKGDLLYMSQALIGPAGEELEVRHKVRPSGSERKYFSDTTMQDNLDVVQTPLGRLGMLECWEHLHAQMFYPMHAKGENLHISAWPYLPFDGEPAAFWEDKSVAESAARMYAIEGGTWAITPAVGAAFIMNSQGVIVSQATPTDEFVTATVTPRNFGGADKFTATGENSWGVLQMIGDTFPESARVPDTNHGKLNEVPLQATSTPTPTPTPSESDTPDPTPLPTSTPTADTELTDATRGGLALAPASGAPGTTVTGSLPAAAGTTVNVWLHSDPQLVGRVTVSAEGTFTFTVPTSAPVGAHRIVVQDATGALLAWAPFEVTAPVAALAVTGGTIGGAALLGIIAIAAGWVLVARRRRATPQFV